jgi:hypothetical protein
MGLLTFKIGDTFQYSGAVSSWPGLTDLTGFTLLAELRKESDGALIATVVGSVLDGPNRIIQLLVTNTDTWLPGIADLDVVFRSPSGDEYTTQTVKIQLIKRITQGA